MKQKTAIRQLIEKLEVLKKTYNWSDLPAEEVTLIAKELESVNEQQIIDAYAGVLKYDKFAVHKALLEKGQQYLNENFEKL